MKKILFFLLLFVIPVQAQNYLNGDITNDSLVVAGAEYPGVGGDTTAAVTIWDKVYTKTVRGIRDTVTIDDLAIVNDYIDFYRITVYDAIAWYPPTTNGADLEVINSREEVYAFDTATAETLYIKMDLHPDRFTSVDSVDIICSVNSTAGDTVQWVLGKAEIALGDDHSDAIGNADTIAIDLGGTANLTKRARITSVSGSFSAGGQLIWRLYRDVAAANDVAADVRLHMVRFYWK